MDKETLSNYGWIVICVLVLAVMIALATPFGSYISSAVKSTTQGLFDVNKNALNSTGLINIGDQSFGEGGNGGTGQSPVIPENPSNPETTFTFTIDGTTYQAEEGMTWAQWCESGYNPNKYTCLAGARVITKDSNGNEITTIYSSTLSGGSVTLDDAEGNHRIIKDKSYQSVVANYPGITVLRASDHDFTIISEMGYTTYDDIANGLKNGQILAVLSGNKTFTAYNDCFVAVNIYIDGSTTPSVTTNVNIIPATQTISLSGIPETTQWYLADSNHNKTGSVLGTGTSLSYNLTKNTDFVLVLNHTYGHSGSGN